MARVEQRPPAAVASRPVVSSNDVTPVSKNQKHKVVLESVTQEKKKLRQVITFNAKPPLGYTFIPAGNPELTNALKEASRKNNAEVFTVTTTPHANVHDLSQQVHRIGYHFSSIVVADVCHQHGLQLSASGHVVGNSYETFLKGYRGRGAPGSEEEGWDQTTLNTKARDAIKDLFPNIPDNDLYQIIKTAFQKGKKRVGTASELPLARRAQLAVVAHIRHCYTAYDRLLRNGGYHDARGVVEKPTLAKLVEWRGDDENGTKVLEDVFREVVVISDEEDSDDDDYDPEAPLKELSVEIVPRNVNTGSQQPKPDHQRRASGYQGDVSTGSDDDAPTSFHYVARRPKRLTNDQQKIDRRGLTQHQAWNMAREQYRANPQRQIITESRPAHQPNYPSYTDFNGSRENVRDIEPRPAVYRNELPEHESAPPPFRQTLPETIRGADGALYTRIASPQRYASGRALEQQQSGPSPYDPSRPSIPAHLRPPPPPLPVRGSAPPQPADPFARESEIPLPSIEDDQTNHTPLRRTGVPLHTTSRMTPPINRLPHDVVDLTRSGERPTAKKRRMDDEIEQTYRSSAPKYSHQGPDQYHDQPFRRNEKVEYMDPSRTDHHYTGRNPFENDQHLRDVARYDAPGRLNDGQVSHHEVPFPFNDMRSRLVNSHDRPNVRVQQDNKGRYFELAPVDSVNPAYNRPQQPNEFGVSVHHNDDQVSHPRNPLPVGHGPAFLSRPSQHNGQGRYPELVPLDSTHSVYNGPKDMKENIVPLGRNEAGRNVYDQYGRPLNLRPEQIEPQRGIHTTPLPDHQIRSAPSNPYTTPKDNPYFRPRFDGAPEPLPSDHRFYERIDSTRDNLPRRMETLAVDPHPGPTYRVQEEYRPRQPQVDQFGRGVAYTLQDNRR